MSGIDPGLAILGSGALGLLGGLFTNEANQDDILSIPRVNPNW